ncbi:MAG: hypothetical protein USCAAHI_00865 [Beijerinckiaceae bacterium]|jgi:hypothetical protein|nr:MAG: hypothetical protein USCAAHI_00865 [Beijerinckiaceae bacterium]
MVRMVVLRKHNINYLSKYRNMEDYVFLAEIIILVAQAFLIPQACYVYVLSFHLRQKNLRLIPIPIMMQH